MMQKEKNDKARQDDLLHTYLSSHPHHHEFREHWHIQGEMRVRLSLAKKLPPTHVSSSILSVVVDSMQRVLFLWPSEKSGNISQLLIGGRPEPGETPEETAIREVGEETGWRIKPIQMIGFRHFFHLEPRSMASDRPYPDFIQPIYAAVAVVFDPDLLRPDDQIPAEFLDLAYVEQTLEPSQHPLLHTAVNVCRDSV